MNFLLFFFVVAGFFSTCEPTIRQYFRFVRGLFVPPENLQYSTAVIFDRNQGEVNRERFEKVYGTQGQKLVDAYGSGLSKKELQDLGYL